MYSFLFVVLLLPTLSNSADIFPFGSAQYSNNCTFEETLIPTAVCSRYVHQLSSSFALRNVSKLCDEMKACFGRSHCEGVRRTGEFYGEKCDGLELSLHSMGRCLRNYYEKRDYGNVSCMIGYELEFKNASTIKIPVGKDCLKTFASQHCNEDAVYYIEHYYEKLLNLLTVDSDGPGRCESVHDRLEAYQCEFELNRFSEVINEFRSVKDNGRPFEKNESFYTPLYESLEKCMLRYCFFTDEMLAYMREYHDEMITYSRTRQYQILRAPLSFGQCLETIMITDVSRIYCVRQMFKTEKKRSDGANMDVPLVKLYRFLKDKDCLKTVMAKKCAWMDLTMFDQEWERLQKDMKDVKDGLIGY